MDKKSSKFSLHFQKRWCIMAIAVTLIAKKREVAIAVNFLEVCGWVFRGANVKRPEHYIWEGR